MSDEMTDVDVTRDEDPVRVDHARTETPHLAALPGRDDAAALQARIQAAQHAKALGSVQTLLAPLDAADVRWARWHAPHDPVTGDRRPTEVACERPDGTPQDRVVLYARTATDHGSGHTWFRIGDIDTDRVAEIAPPTDLEHDLAPEYEQTVDRGPTR